MSDTHIAVVLGTARNGRQSVRVARATVALIEEMEGMSAELVDVKDHITEAVTLPPWGEGGANDQPTKWQEIVQRSSAIVLVIPEYNHGYPGELKLLLDSLFKDYEQLPVSVMGVSAGGFGGARVIEHIMPVLIALGLRPIREAVTVANVNDAFTEEGTFQADHTSEYVTKMVDALTDEIKRAS